MHSTIFSFCKSILLLSIFYGFSFGFLPANSIVLKAVTLEDNLVDNQIIYVDSSATGANNGTSWTDAFTSMQAAIGVAVSGTSNQIYVAKGTYRPSQNKDGTSTGAGRTRPAR